MKGREIRMGRNPGKPEEVKSYRIDVLLTAAEGKILERKAKQYKSKSDYIREVLVRQWTVTSDEDRQKEMIDFLEKQKRKKRDYDERRRQESERYLETVDPKDRERFRAEIKLLWKEEDRR